MIYPANAVVGYPSHTPMVTFSSDGWTDTNYPISNLGAFPLSLVARSDTADLADTQFFGNFTNAEVCQLFVFCRHNFTINAKFRIRIYEDAARTTLLADSGWLKIWDVVYSEDEISWDGGTWWDRTFVDSEIQGYPWYKPFRFSEPYLIRSFHVEIDDTTNPDGFVQMGMFDVSESFQFPVNFDYGARYGYRSRTTVEEAIGGTKYRLRQPKPRVFRGSINRINRNTALSRFFEMKRQLDLDGKFFWWPDPTDSTNVVRNSFMASFSELDLQTYASVQSDEVPISLEEDL